MILEFYIELRTTRFTDTNKAEYGQQHTKNVTIGPQKKSITLILPLLLNRLWLFAHATPGNKRLWMKQHFCGAHEFGNIVCILSCLNVKLVLNHIKILVTRCFMLQNTYIAIVIGFPVLNRNDVATYMFKLFGTNLPLAQYGALPKS